MKPESNGAVPEWDNRLLLPILVSALITLLLIMGFGGGWLAETTPFYLAYPEALVIDIIVVIFGIAVCGDRPGALMEMGVEAIITLAFCVVMLPVFGQAHAKARTQNCLTYLHTLGTALLLYMQDYDITLPPANRWSDLAGLYIPADSPGKRQLLRLPCPATYLWLRAQRNSQPKRRNARAAPLRFGPGKA